MKYKRFLLGLALIFQSALLFTFPLPASADTLDNHMTLTLVGAHDNVAYMAFETPLSGTCAFNIVYIDLSTDGGKAMYSLALTARATKIPLNSINYTLRGDACFATKLDM